MKKYFSVDGFIVDKVNFEQYRIPLDIISTTGKPVYGDMVWCAYPGVLVSPDYFHSAKDAENGMHGYIDVVEDHSTGLFITDSTLIEHTTHKKEHSSKVCVILAKMLEVQTPNSSLWNRKVM